MTRLLILLAVTLPSTACVASTHGRLGASGPDIAPSDVPPPASEPDGASRPGHGPDEDEHWFTSDDYLVSERPYEGQPRRYIRQGKMLNPPTAATKSEARFLLSNGKELWTAHYWRSRVATERDLSIGALVFCPHGSGRAPTDERSARRMAWLLGAVTDLSDLFKGTVAVGNRECEVRALRVPIE